MDDKLLSTIHIKDGAEVVPKIRVTEIEATCKRSNREQRCVQASAVEARRQVNEVLALNVYVERECQARRMHCYGDARVAFIAGRSGVLPNRVRVLIGQTPKQRRAKA